MAKKETGINIRMTASRRRLLDAVRRLPVGDQIRHRREGVRYKVKRSSTHWAVMVRPRSEDVYSAEAICTDPREVLAVLLGFPAAAGLNVKLSKEEKR